MKTRRLLFTIALALGLTLSWLWLLGGNLPYVRAAGYTVDNIGDSGPGSLRQAINSANGIAGHDTITFTANVSGAIVLASELPAIGDDLTITGPGAEVLAVSGAGAYRVFSITQGVAVTITGLTVRDGYADSNGGGIWTAGSLSLDSVHVMNNVVTDTNDNDADYHGYGSGVYVYTGSVTLSQTQVFSNVANRGGGLYIEAGSVTMNGTQVFNNAASTSGGGGLYVDQGSVTLLSETQVFNNNAAFNGGGLYVYQGSASLSETQVFSNVADDSGGGLYITSNSTVTLSGTQILSNTASSGGGIHTEGDLSMDGGEIAGNVASGGMSDNGGGLRVDGGDAVLNGVLIFGNTAGSGGGVDIYKGSVTLSGTQVFSNTALAGGGLATDASSRMVLNGTRVFGNTGCGLDADGASVTLGGTQIEAYGDAKAICHDGGTITTTSALTIVGDVQLRYDARFFGSDHDLRIEGALDLQAGDFYAPEGPTSTFTITGPYTHTGGTYQQSQLVNGSADIGFPSNKFGSVIINANNQDLGRTEVVDLAGVECPGVPAGEAVAHCYIITPTIVTGRAATVTFFYQRDELPPVPSGYSCTTIEAYRWTGAWDTMLTRDTSYGDSGWLCDSGDPQSIRVAGVDAFGTFALHQPAREIAVVPLALDFGKHGMDNREYPSQTVTITNKGLGDLRITDIEVTGNDPEQFHIVRGGVWGVDEIIVGGYSTHTVQVSFHPTRTGVMSAFLSIYSDDTDEPTVTVALSGTAVGVAKIGIKPYQLDFGEQDVDAGPTASQTVNITNTGELDLHITNIELTGLHAANYVIESGGNPVTLTSNSKHTVQVSFNPMSTGVLSMAALRIDSDASNTQMGWTMVQLTGTGTGIVPTYTLTVNKAGTGSGTVMSDPEGIACGVGCTAVFTGGTVVSLTAVADTGSTFAGWTGSGCQGTGTCQVTMAETRQVTATFDVIPMDAYTLTLHVVGQGVISQRVPTGTVTLPPASSFPAGTVLTLTAHPASSWTFVEWSGDLTGTTNPMSLTMSAPREVTATFTTRFVYLPLVIRKTS